MSNRVNPYAKHFAIVKPLIDLSAAVMESGIEKSILELIKVRASQINGCGVCLDMHSKEAIAGGESAHRLLMLDAWRETTLFSPREQAALAWTESLTRLAEKGAPDTLYDEVRAQFSDEEMVKLTMMIGVINSFNRIGVGFHVPPLSEQKAKAA